MNTEEVIYDAIECATRVFGDLSRAREWLHAPYPGFGGLTPLELAVKGGLSTVVRELNSVDESNVKLTVAAVSDHVTLDPATALRQRLAELDPNSGGPCRKVPASAVVAASVDRALSDLTYQFGISRRSVVSAAGVWWVREFERKWGKPIPLDPLEIHVLPPGLVRQVVEGLWGGDASKVLNSSLPEEIDQKVSKVVYLMRRSGWRVSKRTVLGSSIVMLTQDLVQLATQSTPGNAEASES